MKKLTAEEQRELIRRMDQTYRILEEMRLNALRNKPYDWQEVNTLLELGDYYDGPRRLSSGLVQYQEIMKRARERDEE